MTKKNIPQERKVLRKLKRRQALFYVEFVEQKSIKEKAVNVDETLEFDAVIFPIETRRRIVTAWELHPQNNTSQQSSFYR